MCHFSRSCTTEYMRAQAASRLKLRWGLQCVRSSGSSEGSGRWLSSSRLGGRVAVELELWMTLALRRRRRLQKLDLKVSKWQTSTKTPNRSSRGCVMKSHRQVEIIWQCVERTTVFELALMTRWAAGVWGAPDIHGHHAQPLQEAWEQIENKTGQEAQRQSSQSWQWLPFRKKNDFCPFQLLQHEFEIKFMAKYLQNYWYFMSFSFV